jgi:predicted PurR-regulated permease PerM
LAEPPQYELVLGNRELLVLLLLVLALCAAGVLLFFVGRRFSTSSDPAKSNYSEQIQSLDNAKSALDSLGTYIDQQKKQLELSRSSLAALKDEENKIHPLVEADKKVIDAMFAVQEQRNQTAQKTERWIGFALGVLASLIASLIYAIISNLAKRRRTLRVAQS